MSEAISIAFAAAAVAACTATVGLAVSAGKAAHRALNWLSNQAQKEFERLDRELSLPLPEYVTTCEARKE